MNNCNRNRTRGGSASSDRNDKQIFRWNPELRMKKPKPHVLGRRPVPPSMPKYMRMKERSSKEDLILELAGEISNVSDEIESLKDDNAKFSKIIEELAKKNIELKDKLEEYEDELNRRRASEIASSNVSDTATEQESTQTVNTEQYNERNNERNDQLERKQSSEYLKGGTFDKRFNDMDKGEKLLALKKEIEGYKKAAIKAAKQTSNTNIPSEEYEKRYNEILESIEEKKRELEKRFNKKNYLQT